MSNSKMLIVLDGSEKAFRIIDYICSFKPFHKYKLVLHNVIFKVPEYYYDLKKEQFTNGVPSQVRAWELGYRSQMETFMEKARMKLIYAGIDPRNITILIANRKRGITRDIMDEARNGYDCVLIRRQSAAQQFLPFGIGSLATKLFHSAKKMTIWMIP